MCKRCAAKDEHVRPYCETCNVCQIAEKNGSSMTKALAIIAELHPESVKRGTLGCAATTKSAKPCRKCIRHVCAHCETPFRSHANGSYCTDLCRNAAKRESQRLYNEKRREKALAEAA